MNSNPDEPTRILLICSEGLSRKTYLAELARSGTSTVCVPSLMVFFRIDTYTSISGIMVDMPTYIRSSDEEKRLLSEIVDLFPSLRLKCHEPSGEIRSIPFGKTFPGAPSLVDFINTHCTQFTSRFLRSSERSNNIIPMLLNTSHPTETTPGDRTVSTNFSADGCFLIRFEPMNVGAQAWLTIPEVLDLTPLHVEVCWVRNWGEGHSLPGIGVQFIHLTAAQKSALTGFGGRTLLQSDCT